MSLNTLWIRCPCKSDAFGFYASVENYAGPQSYAGAWVGSLHACPGCKKPRFLAGDPRRFLLAGAVLPVEIPTMPLPALVNEPHTEDGE